MGNILFDDQPWDFYNKCLDENFLDKIDEWQDRIEKNFSEYARKGKTFMAKNHAIIYSRNFYGSLREYAVHWRVESHTQTLIIIAMRKIA